MNKARTNLLAILDRIRPFDERETVDLQDIALWLDGTADIYRRVKPDVPVKHLVVYFVVIDQQRRSLLLMDHLKAGLWLPTGGHVEPDEDPYDTVSRELAEELGVQASFVSTIANLPLFATVTPTRGAGTHTDVSLWYVVAGDEKMWLEPDPREFRGHRWQSYDNVLATDIAALDPAMHRFVYKLEERIQ